MYELKLIVDSIAQFSKFCAKVTLFLHNSKKMCNILQKDIVFYKNQGNNGRILLFEAKKMITHTSWTSQDGYVR